MKIIIGGCGKVGTKLAEILSQQKHELTVVDRDTDTFRKLETLTEAQFVTGNIIDQDIMVKAGIEQADVFLALTGDDNANLFSAQVAKELFKVKRVIVRVDEPVRANAFSEELGLMTICGTELIADQVKKKIGVK